MKAKFGRQFVKSTSCTPYDFRTSTDAEISLDPRLQHTQNEIDRLEDEIIKDLAGPLPT